MSFFGGCVSASTASALQQVACQGSRVTVNATASIATTIIRYSMVSLAVGGAAQSHFANEMLGDHRSSMLGMVGSPGQGGGAESGA